VEHTASVPPEQPPVASAAQPAPSRDRNIALVCAVLLLIGMPIGYLPGSTGDVIGLIGLSLFSLALMAWIVLWVVPRERAAAPGRAARTALILGVLSLVTVLVFWTGIPFALGAGAIALGLSLRELAAASGERGKSTAAVVLGALAVVASFIVLLIG
jgi:hypothetical protein